MAIFIVIALLVGIGLIFMQQPKFGKLPNAERQQHIKNSPNYKDGKFQNLTHTPDLAEGVSYYTIANAFFFGKSKRNTPAEKLPSQKTDLLHLDPQENILVWFGHSSYFMQLDGKTILVDPVFSGAASPIKFTTKAFDGTDVYTIADLPKIDYLFISHDHWDHLDYKTVVELKPKVGKVITGLGTGQHLEYWGYNPAAILEKDWNETITLEDGFVVNTTPARHFSGRTFSRNNSLWMSFVLKTPTQNIFLGGDSGYDSFYKTIGEKFGPFDLAILECGQYNEYWKYIHMMPDEVVLAAKDLNAKQLLPVHWAKFSLGLHDWDEPIIKVSEAARQQNMPLLTPMIGEKVNLKNQNQQFTSWWEGIE